MSETPQAAQPSLEGTMYLFKKPALLNREAHGNLGVVRPARPFGFCQDVRAIPITVSEVASASRHYPIIFSDVAQPFPLAVVGLIDDENLFVDKETGEWEQNTYVPGYLRRYPFALANDKGSDQNNPRMAMIVDEEFEGISADSELKFFENGEPTAQTTQAMEFCQNYERDRAMTMNFSTELAKYDLLTEQVAQFTPEGETSPQPFAKYAGVEESRLLELSDEKFIELRKANILPLLYAQLMSMANWRLIMERRARRHELRGPDVLKSMKAPN